MEWLSPAARMEVAAEAAVAEVAAGVVAEMAAEVVAGVVAEMAVVVQVRARRHHRDVRHRPARHHQDLEAERRRWCNGH